MEKKPDRLPEQLPTALKYAAAVGFVVLAVGLRWLLDPWLGSRNPYLTLLAAVAASVWLGGYRPAVVATVLGYLAGTWLFDDSRGVIGQNAPDFAALVAYVVPCALIIAFGESLIHAQRRARMPKDELQSIFDAAPVAILVAHDPECKRVTGNRFAYEMLGLPAGNISRTAPSGERMKYHILRDGQEVPGDELPLQRATAEGVPVRTQELEFAFDGRASVHVTGSAVPLLDAEGEVRGAIGVYTDITQRKLAEQALLRSEVAQRLLLALHDKTRGLSDPASVMLETVTLIGRHFRVIRCAYGEVDAAQENVQIIRGYTVGVPTEAGIHPLENFGAGLVRELRAGRTALICDLATDSRTEDAQAQATYARMEIGSMICVPLVKEGRFAALLVMSDRGPRRWIPDDARLLEQVAERTWLALENARAEAALRGADRRKDEFLATLAHELRNPLAPIRTALEIVQRLAPADARLRGPLEIAGRQVHHLTRLVDDLLDVARITRGKIQLRRQSIELAGMLRDAVESAQPVIKSLDHQLEVTLPEDPIRVNADPTRLTQIVLNLLNNAAKFTPPGGHLRLSAKREGDRAVVSVRDDGIGIAAADLPQVFEMFSQVSPALERSEQGLGIGLALVRGLVELHGGSVAAFSAGPGKGSEFIVKLPIDESTVEPEQAAAAAADRLPAPCRRVLIVDDNRDAADSLGAILELMGHTIMIAYDGLDAMEKASAHRFDAMLLDIGMPGMNGYEVARQVRELPWGRGTLLVALTGWGQQDDKLRAADAGFDHHLTKPIDAAAVVGLLRGAGGGNP